MSFENIALEIASVHGPLPRHYAENISNSGRNWQVDESRSRKLVRVPSGALFRRVCAIFEPGGGPAL